MRSGRHNAAPPSHEPTGSFGFGQRRTRPPIPTFRPGDKQRVSFIWWRRDVDDPSPVFIERDERIVTLVAVWPVKSSGGVDVRRLDETRVMAWEMTNDVYAHLEERHRNWHLGHFDLVVWARELGIRSVPTLDSGSLFRTILFSEREEAAVIRARLDELVREFTQAV